MKTIGIRELKARASAVVRQVAESGATYSITRHGQTVGRLTPVHYATPVTSDEDRQAWTRLFQLADALMAGASRGRSPVMELSRTRR